MLLLCASPDAPVPSGALRLAGLSGKEPRKERETARDHDIRT
jgi:hypothetical protein